MQSKGGPSLLRAIQAVGEVLAAEGESVGIAVVGGAAMILGGHASRLTDDVDIIAVTRAGRKDGPGKIAPPDPLPAPLGRAVSRVARDFNLPQDWMNSTVGALWDSGLPPGFEKRLRWLQFGGLAVGLAHRQDLIFLKLYAAADSEGPQSVHYQDLLALRPERNHLAAAARWARAQDPSPESARVLEQVLEHVDRDQEEPR